MRTSEFVTFDKANEIISTKLTFSIEQWQYIHESLLALQPSDYKFDETCDDLSLSFYSQISYKVSLFCVVNSSVLSRSHCSKEFLRIKRERNILEKYWKKVNHQFCNKKVGAWIKMRCTNADNELKHCSLKNCPYFSDNLMMYNFEKNDCPYNLPPREDKK